ncbi:glycoside hydrolase family 9 protein [Marinimicrobium sp. C2-29]|uniref:glycoside hydrolase family 9 protein n=1 Tax=Marinimicrobium sp. C2-29 TaxID=3139825 RepID=UPI003139808A
MVSAMTRSISKAWALLVSATLCLFLVTGCGSSGSDADDMETPSNPTDGEPNEDDNSDTEDDSNADDGEDQQDQEDSENDGELAGGIRLNQLGFLPDGRKWAVIPDVAAENFSIIDAQTDSEVHTGELSAAANWAPAGESVKLADFSALVEPGEYRVRIEGVDDSPVFSVDSEVYTELNAAALKAYYFNRASIELEETHAGDYARPLGHPDDVVRIHSSAEDGSRSADDEISAPRGWYDAGDFGKYVVNSGISTYTLLAAYEHFPDYYAARDVNIPESGDQWPDILDEALWNLAWMLDMQDEDGGVYHKLTTLNFAGAVMPHEADAQRYVIGKGTSATLNFAAVMAQGSRIWKGLGEDELAAQMLSAAESAWSWAEANPNEAFTNPDDVSTGEYGGNNIPSNFAWAAAELYITTNDDSYYEAFEQRGIDIWVPGWTDSRGLAWMSLAFHRDSLTGAADLTQINNRITGLADSLANSWSSSAYRVPMGTGDFYWGSNSNALNRAMMLLQGYRLSGDEDHRDAAQSLLDYILGRNPTGYSYVTGYGDKTPMDPHHRASYADEVEAPVPGFVVGGPNTDYPADCENQGNDYPAGDDAIAKAYLDDWCSYSTNEVTINWNAPLVYVSGALQAWSTQGED